MSANKSGKGSPRSAMIQAGKAGDYDDDSGDWKKYIPHAIYFYYRTSAGTRVYLWVTPKNEPIKPSMLNGLIVDLTMNARANGSNPRPIGWAFDEVPWWRMSYLVAVADINNYKFDPHNAVTIARDEGGAYSSNHCFFDGWDGELLMPDNKPAQVMWTVNYMMNKSGKLIPPDKIHHFKLKWNGTGGRVRPRDPGDNGTNMGPPIGPPP